MQTELINTEHDYIQIRHSEKGVNVWMSGTAFWGQSRDEAVAVTVARLEAIVDALQSTPSPESLSAVSETKGN